MEKIIEDKELGTILLRVSERARKYSIRVYENRIIATMPTYGDIGHLMVLIRENRENIQKSLSRLPSRPCIDEHYVLKTTTFELRVLRVNCSKFYMQLKGSILLISCPLATDFQKDEVQCVLRGMIEAALRHEAKRCLPPRLLEYARKYGFTVNSIAIKNAKTRWGSCTSRKNINLSLSLMLLPWHLIDYVLLHELCHTREMNHGVKFWTLMDSVTEGKAKALRSELKQYKPL